MTRLDPALWGDMMAYMRRKHSTICRQWFEELEPIGLDAGLLKVYTNNSVQMNYLSRKCTDQFNEAAQAITGALVAVRFTNDEGEKTAFSETVRSRKAEPAVIDEESLIEQRVGQSATATAIAPTAKTSSRAVGTPSKSRSGSSAPATHFEPPPISPDYSFDTFVTGPENQLAHAAAVAIANQPGTAYNPVFIHGGVGLGKTHLLQAICQKLLQDRPDMRIAYLSCDAFVTDFIECVQSGQMNEFRQRYRHADMLVIDDIHFLSDRERTQEEFFHTFNELYQSKRQIVLSSDSPPSEIPDLEERLVSRFQWGLVACVSRPCYETRLAIIQAKAQLRGMEMGDDVVKYIATKIDSNARELEGAITTIQCHAASMNRPIDVTLAHEALGDPYYDDPWTSQVTLQNIIDVVTSYYNVKLSELQSKRRHKSITLPRQVCMWLARKQTRFSLQEIGGYFGGRDHTTVMHSIKTIDDRRALDDQFTQQMNMLDERIKQSV